MVLFTSLTRIIQFKTHPCSPQQKGGICTGKVAYVNPYADSSWN
jgi:hypothetical protein